VCQLVQQSLASRGHPGCLIRWDLVGPWVPEALTHLVGPWVHWVQLGPWPLVGLLVPVVHRVQLDLALVLQRVQWVQWDPCRQWDLCRRWDLEIQWAQDLRWVRSDPLVPCRRLVPYHQWVLCCRRVQQHLILYRPWARLDQFHQRLKDRLDPLDPLGRLCPLDQLDPLDPLDRLDPCHLEQLQLKSCNIWLHLNIVYRMNTCNLNEMLYYY
jgi:hypothetical protein